MIRIAILPIFFMMMSTSQGCHTIKRRSSTRSLGIGTSGTLTSFFSKCLSDRAGKDFRWEAVVRFTVEDTTWYDETSYAYCGGERDTDECWRGQVKFLVDPTSVYIRHIRECIREYASTGGRTTPRFKDNISRLQVARSGRRKRDVGSTFWLSWFRRQRLSQNSAQQTTSPTTAPQQATYRSIPYVPPRAPSYRPQQPAPVQHNPHRTVAPVFVPPARTQAPVVAPRFISPGHPNPSTLPSWLNPHASVTQRPHVTSKSTTLPPVVNQWRVPTQQTTMALMSTRTPLARVHYQSSYRRQPLTQNDMNLLLLLRHYRSMTQQTTLPPTSGPFQYGGSWQPTRTKSPFISTAPGRYPSSGIAPFVTSQRCDDASESRFERCVTTSVENPYMSSMRSLSINMQPRSKDDMASVIRFFQEYASPCSSEKTIDPTTNEPSRACSLLQARSNSAKTCLDTVMIRLVKNDSELRNLFLSCTA